MTTYQIGHKREIQYTREAIAEIDRKLSQILTDEGQAKLQELRAYYVQKLSTITLCNDEPAKENKPKPEPQPEPEPVAKIETKQVARRIFPTCERAQGFADRMNAGSLYDSVVNDCTVDRIHRSGFNISHLADEYTEVLEVAA